MAFSWTGFWTAALEGTATRMNYTLLGVGAIADFPAASDNFKGAMAWADDEMGMYYCAGAVGGWVRASSLMGKTQIPISWSGLTTALSGGTVTQNGVAVVVASGGANTNYAQVYGTAPEIVVGSIFDKEPIYEGIYQISEATASQMAFGLGPLKITKPADGAYAQKAMGFYIVNGALWAYSADGTNESSIDLATALAANTRYRLRQQLTATALKTWVNGTAKTNKTTNLPTGVMTATRLPILSAYRTTATLQVDMLSFILEANL